MIRTFSSTKALQWVERHISQRQQILILSFFVGLFTALAAYILKWLIHTIEELLTHPFDAVALNGYFLYIL